MQNTLSVIFSTLTIICLIVFLLYYPYRVLIEVIPFAFTQPNLWQNHWLVDYTGEIPFVLRLAYFLLWMLPITATMVMTTFAIHFFYLLRKGVYFDLRSVRDIQVVGISASIAGFGVVLGNSLSNWLVTFMNTKERYGIQIWYDSEEVSLIITGLGLYLGGWILKTVVFQDQENSEYV